jgi:hypothetical protein
MKTLKMLVPLVLLVGFASCLTPKQEQALWASYNCGKEMGVVAYNCIQPCKAIALSTGGWTDAAKAECTNYCGERMIHSPAPEVCAEQFGGLASDEVAAKIRALVKSAIDLVDLLAPKPVTMFFGRPVALQMFETPAS